MTLAPDKPLDLAQASQRIAWLDENRRLDHAELALLTQQVASLLSIIKDQALRLRETGDHMAALESSLTRLPRLEDTIMKTRSELPPLRDADIRIQDEVQRHAKDRQSQNDQSSRLWGDVSGRLDSLNRTIDGLAHRLQVVETQRKEVSERAAEMAIRIDALARASDGVAAQLKLLEARDKDRSDRESSVRAQLSHLEAAQPLALDVANRSIARVDSLVTDILQIRKEVGLVKDEDVSRYKQHAAELAEYKEGVALVKRRIEDVAAGTGPTLARIDNLENTASEIKESAAALQRRVDDIVAGTGPILARLGHLEDDGSQIKESAAALQHRVDDIVAGIDPMLARLGHLEDTSLQVAKTAFELVAVQEHVTVLEQTYKGLQEVEDRHWGTDIPEIKDSVEKAEATSQANAATVEALVALNQEMKEEVRKLQVDLVNEHVYTDGLAASLRGVVEEDLQIRLAMAQKQLLSLRHLANAPVESHGPEDEQ